MNVCRIVKLLGLCSSAVSEKPWLNIATAPHDGTIIELQCTYGITPYSGHYYWAKPDNKLTRRACWIEADRVDNLTVGIDLDYVHDHQLHWRPLS